ncbi:allantoinase PuuE [Rubellimicrobium sp. CFH 75288]|uniref:allantoinase PuuE n=1 Tax=Rubellimicrobium sp. CFH 75288 TaxID=2697034 RepID=UPI001411D977|nr:allantoinase PuuE [Rubellimicrobium sp. CFH 75288]NAZ36712.1 allantoinase PuuE [Rubellimicrobium sp. CFH 75288]
MDSPPRYPRDLHGYGATPPEAGWPGGARVAVSLVLNHEEGGENCILHGDPASEAFLSDIPGAVPWPGERHPNMESIYEYGARAGFWRLHRMLRDRPVTVFAVASALARTPAQVAAMRQAPWEIASHGLKWIEHRALPEAEERAQIAEAIRLHAECTGEAPRGWYTGRCSVNTLRLVAETGAFDWVSDAYDDDLPHWVRAGGRDQLVIPYTLECNDMRFATAPGWVTGRDFADYLIDTFETLRAEGGRMMSVGLHPRLVGRPGKAAGLRAFLDHADASGAAWFATRGQIAAHWRARHPPPAFERPSEMGRERFLAAFGGIVEHSPWAAERVWALELGPAHDTAEGLAHAFARVLRSASEAEQDGVLRAHPDLAGRLAQARRLTGASAAEQASAGLDALTDGERARFEALNAAYRERHGFPFIIAVRDHDKAGILRAFERRIALDSAAERAEALRQVERIAALRLGALLP